MTELIWVDPDLPGPSGGSLYNDRVVDALQGLGTTVHRLRVPGPWPHPDEASRRRLLDALARLHREIRPLPVIVDGLIGGCMPELFSDDPSQRPAAPSPPAEKPLGDVLLVHLPLAAEHERTAGSAEPRTVGLAEAEGQAVRAAARVVATSRWAAEDLHRRHGRQKVDVLVPGVDIPSSVDLPSSVDPGRTHSETAPLRLTMAASFTPRKNHRLLGEALSTLLEHDWVLQLAGGGAEQGPGAAMLQELQGRLPGRIVHLGALPPEEMHGLWRRTDLLLLPSWAETYGMVVTEACAHGVPGIVSSGTGAVEALGEAGGTADPDQPEDWARLLESWLTDPQLRGRWAEAARTRADSLPSWEQTANHWQKLIGSLQTG
ncbi:glycosyltransferase [Nesterenkonia xinjiangensis]|uniref:glycosyltransferase n=1 Tax=Nesterenkonia xinjiangensis TaxID=225327 RepID=UPI0015C8D8F6